ncbi:MAG: YdcF family protein [Fuerstiella sp.]
MQDIRYFRVFAACAVIMAAIPFVAWAILDRSAAEKIATALAMPCGILWYLLTCLVIVFATARQYKPTLLALVIWLCYTVCGNSYVVMQLAASLEAPFRDIHPLEQEPFDFVVVLGGGTSIGANQRQQGNGSGDRLILAAQTWHQGVAKKLICTGRRIESMNSSGFDPADQSTDVLVGLGVPPEAIEQVDGRTTSEEMLSLGKSFRNTTQRVGLITSAWHLPRALRLASRNEFYPQPLPADFMSGPRRPMTVGETIIAGIPQADTFAGITRMAKEHLGMLAGR